MTALIEHGGGMDLPLDHDRVCQIHALPGERDLPITPSSMAHWHGLTPA